MMLFSGLGPILFSMLVKSVADHYPSFPAVNQLKAGLEGLNSRINEPIFDLNSKKKYRNRVREVFDSLKKEIGTREDEDHDGFEEPTREYEDYEEMDLIEEADYGENDDNQGDDSDEENIKNKKKDEEKDLRRDREEEKKFKLISRLIKEFHKPKKSIESYLLSLVK